MGHGMTDRDPIMKRTANWQHQVGCMLCGGTGGESHEAEPFTVGHHWLWLCSWCALRVCTECRSRLGEEEQRIKENDNTACRINLRALRSEIIEEKNARANTGKIRTSHGSFKIRE